MGKPSVLPGLSVVLAAACLSGCASTQVRSQADTQAVSRGIRKVMVIVNLQDLGLRQDAERAIQTRLVGHSTQLVPSHQLFFPGRQYSDDECKQILVSNGIEAILVVSAAGSGTTSTYVPQTTTTQGSATVIGNTVYGTAKTRTQGGYSVEKPWAQFDASLYDGPSGKVVWVARMSTAGNAFAKWDHIITSMAKSTADQLVKDGIVR